MRVWGSGIKVRAKGLGLVFEGLQFRIQALPGGSQSFEVILGIKTSVSFDDPCLKLEDIRDRRIKLKI